MLRSRLRTISWIITLTVALSFFLPPSLSFGCAAPPYRLGKHYKKLVSDSKLIALARAVGTTQIFMYHTTYENTPEFIGGPIAKFETIEILRGNVPASFALGNGIMGSKNQNPAEDFDGHNNMVFWDENVAKNRIESDCKIWPKFVVGRTYLIFLDHPHERAYEEIKEPERDLWLSAVRKLIKDPSLSSGLTMNVYEWLSKMHGVFVGRIKSCEGPTFLLTKLS